MNADTFNALHPVGTLVFAYPGARPEDFPKATRLVTRTRSKASVLGGHTDVVWVDGHSACIALSHVDVVPEDEWKKAQLAEAVKGNSALPPPADVAPTVDELLADCAAMDFTDLMDPDAAAVVGSIRDQLVGEIKRLREERTKYVLVPKWEYELLEQQRERAEKAEARLAVLEEKATSERMSFAELARRESDPGRRQAWRMLAQIDEAERVFEVLMAPAPADTEGGDPR